MSLVIQFWNDSNIKHLGNISCFCTMKSLFVFLYYLLLKLQSIKLPLLILCFNLLDRQLILTIFDGENLEHSIYFYTCPKDYIKAWYEYQCPL